MAQSHFAIKTDFLDEKNWHKNSIIIIIKFDLSEKIKFIFILKTHKLARFFQEVGRNSKFAAFFLWETEENSTLTSPRLCLITQMGMGEKPSSTGVCPPAERPLCGFVDDLDRGGSINRWNPAVAMTTKAPVLPSLRVSRKFQAKFRARILIRDSWRPHRQVSHIFIIIRIVVTRQFSY